MRPLIVASVVVALVLAPQPSLAYSDWGWDSDDVNEGSSTISLDLASTRRDTGHSGGRRMLRVTAWIHGDKMGDWWTLRVMLDTRGGSEADFKMTIWNGDLTGNGCVVKRIGSGEEVEGFFGYGDTWGRCRIPVGKVDSSKRIRWNIRSYSNSRPDRVVDRAPDAGWYR